MPTFSMASSTKARHVATQQGYIVNIKKRFPGEVMLAHNFQSSACPADWDGLLRLVCAQDLPENAAPAFGRSRFPLVRH